MKVSSEEKAMIINFRSLSDFDKDNAAGWIKCLADTNHITLNEKRLVKKFRKISPDAQNLILTMIDTAFMECWRSRIISAEPTDSKESNKKTNIRQNVKSLCKKRGISLNQLEKQCHLGTGYVSKLDKSSPSIDNIRRIAEYLNVSLEELVHGRSDGLS